MKRPRAELNLLLSDEEAAYLFALMAGHDGPHYPATQRMARALKRHLTWRGVFDRVDPGTGKISR